MAIDKYDLDAVFGVWPVHETDGITASLAGLFATARKIGQEFRELATSLRKAGNLTPKGLSTRLVEYATQEVDRYDRISAEQLGKAYTDRDRLRARLMTAKTGTDKLDEIATRSALLELPDAQRWATIAQALQDGEQVVLDAVLGAPRFLQRRLMLPEQLELVREEVMRRRDPVAARELAGLEDAIGAAERGARQLRTFIVQTPGVDGAALAEKIGIRGTPVSTLHVVPRTEGLAG